MGSFAYRENMAGTRGSPVGELLGGSGDRFLGEMASVGAFSGCSGEF